MLRYCGSCGAPLDVAALTARWCPACGARITSSGDAVAEGPDDSPVHQQMGPGLGRAAPERDPAVPSAQAVVSPALAAVPARQSRSPTRWVMGALALGVVLALLSGLLVALATHGNLQVIVGPYDFSHGGATGTAATPPAPGISATPSPASSATAGATPASTATVTVTATPTGTAAAALTVSPTSFQLIACVYAQVQITVTDSGGTSLSWSASASVPQYQFNQSGGTLAAGGSITVTVSNIQQSGSVTFTAPGAQGSPQQVSIRCTV